MHQVLISYSTKDKLWADGACAALEARGIRCWIAPRDIMPGTEWGAAIIGGIDACNVMLLIFSASANESPQVRREVERAVSKGLTVVPCRVEDVRPVGAMEYALGNTHWLDVFTPPVERQMDRIAESVQALLSQDSLASIAAGSPPVASDSSPQVQSLYERFLTKWNGQRKHRRVAAVGGILILVVAASLVVFWPRSSKDAASSSEKAAFAQAPVPALQTASIAKSAAAATSATAAPANVGITALPSPSAQSLFNGKDATGWQGDPSIWTVADGHILA